MRAVTTLPLPTTVLPALATLTCLLPLDDGRIRCECYGVPYLTHIAWPENGDAVVVTVASPVVCCCPLIHLLADDPLPPPRRYRHTPHLQLYVVVVLFTCCGLRFLL